MRSAQHLDALDIVEIFEIKRDAIGKHRRGAGRRVVAAGQSAQDQLAARIRAARNRAVNVVRGDEVAGFDFRRPDHGDIHRDLHDQFRALARGHVDFLELKFLQRFRFILREYRRSSRCQGTASQAAHDGGV